MVNQVHITPPPLSSQSMADLLCTIILLVRGTDARRKQFWAYMCIKPSMAQAFKDAQNSPSFVLEDFGTIIETGDGHEVPSDVQKRMERDYGVRHDYETALKKAIEQVKKKNSA